MLGVDPLRWSFPRGLVSDLSVFGGPALRQFLTGIPPLCPRSVLCTGRNNYGDLDSLLKWGARVVKINVPLQGVGPERYGGDEDPIMCLANQPPPRWCAVMAA